MKNDLLLNLQVSGLHQIRLDQSGIWTMSYNSAAFLLCHYKTALYFVFLPA